MKLFAIAAAAAVALTSFAGAPASAQMASRHTERTVTRTVETRQVQRNNGWHNGWRTKRVCNVRWSHHRKIRSCRTIRVRR